MWKTFAKMGKKIGALCSSSSYDETLSDREIRDYIDKDELSWLAEPIDLNL